VVRKERAANRLGSGRAATVQDIAYRGADAMLVARLADGTALRVLLPQVPGRPDPGDPGADDEDVEVLDGRLAHDPRMSDGPAPVTA